MLADHLDGLAQLDLLAVDGHADLLNDSLCNLGGGDGTKELTLLANASENLDGLAVQSCLQGVCVGGTSKLTLCDVVTTLLELLELALGGLDCKAVGDQVVDCEALSDVDNVTLAAAALEFLSQNNLHVKNLSKCPAMAQDCLHICRRLKSCRRKRLQLSENPN